MNAVLSVVVGLAVSAPVVTGLIGGILGDGDDNERVDEMDLTWVKDSSTTWRWLAKKADYCQRALTSNSISSFLELRFLMGMHSTLENPSWDNISA